MKGIFSVLVENQAGVLSKTAGLFARRGYNIDSLAVGETENKEISNMTIVSTGDARVIDQIEKQLNKKIDIIKVRRLKELQSVCRELLMMKISYNATNRKDIMEICMIMNAKIVHVSPKSMIVELNDSPDIVESFIRLMQPFGIMEMARTGVIALQKDEI